MLPCLQGCSGTAPTPHRDALGEVGILDHVGRLQVLMIDRVVRLPVRARSCGESPAAGAAPSDAPWRATSPPYAAVAPLLAARDTALRRFQRPLGLAIPAGMEDRVPSESVAKPQCPRSMPGFLSRGGKRLYRHSAQEKQHTSHPLPAIVTVLGVPSIGRDQRTAIRPILERTRKPLSSVAPLPNCL